MNYTNYTNRRQYKKWGSNQNRDNKNAEKDRLKEEIEDVVEKYSKKEVDIEKMNKTIQKINNEIEKYKVARNKGIFIYQIISNYYHKLQKKKKGVDNKEKVKMFIDVGKLYYVAKKEKNNPFIMAIADILQKAALSSNEEESKRLIEGIYLIGLGIQPNLIKSQ